MRSRERILGLTRVRNESSILQETLDHFAEHCDAGILLLDDASVDDTSEIAHAHPAVVDVLRNHVWRADRIQEEWRLRQVLLHNGRALSPDWFLYFDADERLEWNGSLPADADAVAMRLFDAYITPEDEHLVGTSRSWFGPEYRDIVMLFRNLPRMSYHLPDQRQVAGPLDWTLSGYVQHYGKAISVDAWEETCSYYVDHFPEPYRSKWDSRRGKAVHTESDFGRPLLRWHQVKEQTDYCLHGVTPYEPLEADGLALLDRAAASWFLCPSCDSVLILERHPAARLICTRCLRAQPA